MCRRTRTAAWVRIPRRGNGCVSGSGRQSEAGRERRTRAAIVDVRSGRFSLIAGSAMSPRASLDCLADLDEVSVGVADVGPDLVTVVFRLGEELGALGGPLPVCPLDVGDADVEEAADLVRIRWRGEDDGGLVIGRAAALVEDQPGVSDLQDDGVTLAEHLSVEQCLIVVAGAVLV